VIFRLSQKLKNLHEVLDRNLPLLGPQFTAECGISSRAAAFACFFAEFLRVMEFCRNWYRLVKRGQIQNILVGFRWT